MIVLDNSFLFLCHFESAQLEFVLARYAKTVNMCQETLSLRLHLHYSSKSWCFLVFFHGTSDEPTIANCKKAMIK